MSTSSQLQTSLDDLLKDLTIDLSNTSSTTLTSSSDYSYTYDNTMSTITLCPSISVTADTSTFSSNTVTIGNSSIVWHMPTEWVDCFPDWDKVEDMCKKYPGLEIAFRNFQTVYQLVKDDYDNPVPKK
jgi:hypothetical protein